jgi:hypothetical protein
VAELKIGVDLDDAAYRAAQARMVASARAHEDAVLRSVRAEQDAYTRLARQQAQGSLTAERADARRLAIAEDHATRRVRIESDAQRRIQRAQEDAARSAAEASAKSDGWLDGLVGKAGLGATALGAMALAAKTIADEAGRVVAAGRANAMAGLDMSRSLRMSAATEGVANAPEFVRPNLDLIRAGLSPEGAASLRESFAGAVGAYEDKFAPGEAEKTLQLLGADFARLNASPEYVKAGTGIVANLAREGAAGREGADIFGNFSKVRNILSKSKTDERILIREMGEVTGLTGAGLPIADTAEAAALIAAAGNTQDERSGATVSAAVRGLMKEGTGLAGLAGFKPGMGAVERLRSTFGVLGEEEARGGDLYSFLTQQGIADEGARSGLLSLYGSREQLKDRLKEAGTEADPEAAIADMERKRSADLSLQLDIAKGREMAAKIEQGMAGQGFEVGMARSAATMEEQGRGQSSWREFGRNTLALAQDPSLILNSLLAGEVNPYDFIRGRRQFAGAAAEAGVEPSLTSAFGIDLPGDRAAISRGITGAGEDKKMDEQTGVLSEMLGVLKTIAGVGGIGKGSAPLAPLLKPNRSARPAPPMTR